MSKIKTYELFTESGGVKNDIDPKEFEKINVSILNTVDILTSFIEDLSDLKFTNYDKPINIYITSNGWHGSKSLVEVAKYVNDNIDKPIPTISWNLTNVITKNVDIDDLNSLIEGFMSRLEEFAPTCRIDNFKKGIELVETLNYTKQGLMKTKKNTCNIALNMIDTNKTRYKRLFTNERFNFFNKKYNNIKLTQICDDVDLNKIKSIRNDMLSSKYDFNSNSNKIAYEYYDGVVYITEGHHRFLAAASISEEMMNKLIDNGVRYDINRKPTFYIDVPNSLINKIKI
jgi:hypothetical protein